MSLTGLATSEGAGAKARAKINLYLHMVGRRADGYHLLESLVAFTEFGDRVRARPAQTLSLELEGPFAGTLGRTPPQDNLVLRAAHMLQAWALARGQAAKGAQLILDKQLPVASGIGGGSADAAAALHALAALWRLPISAPDLARLGERLGADVPACLMGRPALMAGIGEDLTPLAGLPALPLVLVNPGVELPTPAVYRAFRAQGDVRPGPRPKPPGPWRDGAALVADLAPTANDLEAAAISLCPPVGTVLAALNATGALLVRMSGSGATCFGLYAARAQAAQAAAQLAAAQPGWWVRASVLEDRPPGSGDTP